jgi:iron-sulfur cluster repair protein YtfE (RIC family)
MKATDLLTKQHEKVKGIFAKLEAQKGDAAALLAELADDLAAHMAIEQDIFYPQVLAAKPDLIAESFEEHAVAELALKRLVATDPGDATFVAKVTTLKELIEHHVEEEQDELFPAVEKAFSAEALVTLGGEMKTAFDEARKSGFEGLVPKTFGHTTSDAANIIGTSKKAARSAHAV